MFKSLWHDSKLMGLLASFLTLFAIALFTTVVGRWFIQLPYFAIKKFEIVGEVERLNMDSFKTAVLPKVQGSFFSINLEATKGLVEDQAWVRKAVVQRVWPNGLKVSVQSHKPLALWGDTRLLNTFGEVFAANPAEAGEPDSMAVLHGPPGSEFLVAKTYVTWIKDFSDIGMVPASVKLSDRYGWTVKTKEGLAVELGRDQEPLSLQAKINRLKVVYPKLRDEVMKTVEVIDMRYAKAFAVKGEKMTVTRKANIELKTN
jgi:cell division protein FtsQ